MDTEALHVALQQSFSPDANLRDPAEKAIKSLKNVKGATVMLLQVVAEKQVTYIIMLNFLEKMACLDEMIIILFDHNIRYLYRTWEIFPSLFHPSNQSC